MIPLCSPTLPKIKSIQNKLKAVFKSGMLTNAKYVAEFEKQSEKFLKAKNAVAVSSGTAGLILALKCLNLKGEVILSSFTFSSTGHALLWCGLKPVFVDIDPETFNINPNLIEEKITSKTSAILATHIFGNPCQIDEIQKIAQKHNLKVVYDAAHAFGSKYKGKSVAKPGDAAVFSFTPTKILTTGEGGMVFVKNRQLAERLKLGRNNGDSFDRKEEFLGISGRMDEFSAILGIEGLKIFPKYLKRRLEMINLYKKELADIPGISFQRIADSDFSAFKDIAILINKEKFGRSRDEVLKELLRNNIQCKVYFCPPLHKKKVYKKYKTHLPATEFVSKRIMSLPLYSHMKQEEVIKVCSLVKKLTCH